MNDDLLYLEDGENYPISKNIIYGNPVVDKFLIQKEDDSVFEVSDDIEEGKSYFKILYIKETSVVAEYNSNKDYNDRIINAMELISFLNDKIEKTNDGVIEYCYKEVINFILANACYIYPHKELR